jgi:hypothetical protein
LQQRVGAHDLGREEVVEVASVTLAARAGQDILQIDFVAVKQIEIADLVHPRQLQHERVLTRSTKVRIERGRCAGVHPVAPLPATTVL